MKTTSSTPVSEVRNERRVAIQLAVGEWEEEAFNPVIRLPDTGGTVPELNNWEDIEAVGAADDASRFRIDSPLEELTGSHP